MNIPVDPSVSNPPPQRLLDQMELALNLIQEAVVWTDAQGRIERYNAAFAQLVQTATPLGQSLLELLPLGQSGSLLFGAAHPIACPTASNPMCCELIQTDRVQSLEIVSAELSAGLSAEPSGKLFVIRVLPKVESNPDISDIPDCKHGPDTCKPIEAALDAAEAKFRQVEAQLQQQQQFLRAVIDNNPNLIFVKDSQGRYLLANRAIADMYGITVEELLQTTVYDLNPDRQMAEEFMRQNRQVIDTQQPLFISEERLVIPQDTGRWLQWQKQPIYLPEQQTYGVLGIGVEITERKQAEAALRNILQGTASATGEEFFPILVQNLASALGVRHAFVAELSGQQLRTLAFWSNQQIQPNRTFDLSTDSCCRMALAQGIYCCPHQVQQQFSNLALLKQLKAESYLGVAMLDGAGKPIGNLCIIDDKPLKDIGRAEAVLRIFAARAAAELERQWATVALQQLNQDLEARVEQRTQELIALLNEKEVLLKELHHRVKNNLQMIQSLLNLQARSLEDPQILEVLTESQKRIRAMALVHEKLYQSSLARINFAEYVRSLMRDLLQSYGGNLSAVQLAVQVAEVELPVDTAISCGLIINELFSNAIKYAFPGNQFFLRGDAQTSVITVQFKTEQAKPNHPSEPPTERYVLTVSDNGIGIPESVNIQTTRSLGLRLVYALTRQLRGTLDLDRHHGTQFTITFAKPT